MSEFKELCSKRGKEHVLQVCQKDVVNLMDITKL